MSGKLCILGCRSFHPEIAAAIAAEGWPDVTAADYPTRCGRPAVSWAELSALVGADCDQVVVLGRACLHGLGEPPEGFPPTRLLPLGECFHQVAGPTLVAEAIARGAYLITPGWLAQWRERLGDLGLTPESAGELFSDFARELLLLDTGVDPQSSRHLAELAEVVKLPARRIAVGLDYTRLLLAAVVARYRQEAAERSAAAADRRHAAELADQTAAIDLMTQVAQATQEADTIAAIEETFHMLFAPAALHYLQLEGGIPAAERTVPPEWLEPMRALTAPYAWTPTGDGFLLRISHGAQTLGVVALERLAFPQYRERYLNLALSLAGICGLAIDNARNRRRLVEAEKMASLGVMVAGMAHEINTPVGVGRTAVSTLQQQAAELARRFAERRMTQSDLADYLETARTALPLVANSLERIGQLSDSFRQLAVDDGTLERQHFPLRACLDDVIKSLGERLPREGVKIELTCDAAMEIDSYPGDWATILINLVSNSLKHGFKGRPGTIRLCARREAGRLLIDYFDDGEGMSPEALARVFDPFFSTDLQHGMGLGMHLVYNLITHRLGGTIRCDSHPGQGVHFQLEIPQ